MGEEKDPVATGDAPLPPEGSREQVVAFEVSLLNTLAVLQESMREGSAEWEMTEALKEEVKKDAQLKDAKRALLLLFHKRNILEEVFTEFSRDITVKL